MLPEKRVFRWGEAELTDLARAELELNEGVIVRMINIHLQREFSYRTVGAIGKVRSHNARYSEIIMEMKRNKELERGMIVIEIDNERNT